MSYPKIENDDQLIVGDWYWLRLKTGSHISNFTGKVECDEDYRKSIKVNTMNLNC